MKARIAGEPPDYAGPVQQKEFFGTLRERGSGAQVLPSSKSKKKIRIKGETAWLANQTYWSSGEMILGIGISALTAKA
jgi:hypothetical protein